LLGTGGVSIYALQIAKAMGAYVAITSSSDEKLEKAKALGADFIVNYKAEPEWGSAVNAWSGEKGVDHVVEVGGPATLASTVNQCVSCEWKYCPHWRIDRRERRCSNSSADGKADQS